MMSFSTELADSGHPSQPLTPDSPGATQPLLGHARLEGTVRYLDIDFEDANEMVEQADV